MIEFLRLRNVGVIESAEFEIGPGLTVLTGETGAGKTMVLTAVNLLLGARLPAGLTTGKDTAVQGEWTVDRSSAFASQLDAAGVDVTDDELLLTRTLPKSGRSRISANGTVIPQSLLAQWAEDMVAVHGQSEQVLLRRKSRQRQVLDRFGGPAHRALTEAYRDAFSHFGDVAARLEVAQSSIGAVQDEIARLGEGLAAIEKVRPGVGEDNDLAERASRLTNLSVLQASAANALTALDGVDDSPAAAAIHGLHAAQRALESVGSIDDQLATIGSELKEAAILVQDVVAELTRYLTDLDADPDRLDAIQTRRADIAALTRAYGPTVADVLAWEQDAIQRLNELHGLADVSALLEEHRQARETLGRHAADLSQARRAVADEFATLVTAELQGLAMPSARLEVAINSAERPDDSTTIPLPSGQFVAFGPSGIDEVEFLLRPHAGADPSPISKAASGGELSRIMLALEVVLQDAATAPTMIFDEVDAGVGGQAAVEIGRRLQQLGQSVQVLVVTHLPQVAAFADQHLTVTKNFDGTVTSSNVENLDRAQRVAELARMLAGQSQSRHAVAHAEELLDLAQRRP